MSQKLFAAIAILGCALYVGCGQQQKTSDTKKMAAKRAPTRALHDGPSASDDGGPARLAGLEESYAKAAMPAEAAREFGTDAKTADSPDVVTAEPADPFSPSRPPTPRPRSRPDRHVQSGTLTAGSFDDHRRFEDYQRFLSEAMQQDIHEVLPRVERGRRVVIRVVDSQHRPLGDARVVVRHGDSQSTLLDAATAADGRVFFMSDRGGPGQFDVSITPPDGSDPITETIDAGQSPFRIVLPGATAELPRRLDLALVVDTTGSMGDELEYLKVEIDDIAGTIHDMFPNVDQRYALIVYRDQSDSYVTRRYDFTGSLDEFRSRLAAQSAGGGGDYPEAMHAALEQAGELSWRDRDTARVLFLVGDAPPHDRFAGRTIEAVEALRRQCVRVFPTAASGVRTKAEFIMRLTAFLTQGEYLFLTDHSGVGNPHAAPHVPDYQVEHLNRLMVRMIAQQLAGRQLQPEDVVAIEQGARPVSQPIEAEPRQPQHQGQQTSTPPRPHHVTRSHRAEAGLFTRLPPWLLLAAIAVSLFAYDAISSRAES